jgi:hypothetical protein
MLQNNQRRLSMKSMLLITAAGLFLAASSCAFAFDITSDPDATMNQQQKLGPNVYSLRGWNRTYNFKTGAYAYYPRYRYYRHYRRWR